MDGNPAELTDRLTGVRLQSAAPAAPGRQPLRLALAATLADVQSERQARAGELEGVLAVVVDSPLAAAVDAAARRGHRSCAVFHTEADAHAAAAAATNGQVAAASCSPLRRATAVDAVRSCAWPTRSREGSQAAGRPLHWPCWGGRASCCC